MGRIYRRGEVYWGDWTDTSGKRRQQTLRTKDRKVAKERLHDAELAATPNARGRRQRLGEAIDYVIGTMHDKAEGTRDMYRKKGRRLFATMGDPYIHEITRDMVTAYIARRLSDEPYHGRAKPHTVQKELITLRRALSEAADRKILAAMPVLPKFSPRYDPREVWLTEPQFEAVCAELEPRRRLWASLACLGGLRAGEVERLTWGMIDWPINHIRVPGTKTVGSRRSVPMAPTLRARLEAAPPGPASARVVERWSNVRRDLHAAADRANAASGKAEIPHVSPNDLRRTFASWLVQHGVDLHRVATLMGHNSSRMVEKVYGKLTRENLDSAIAQGFATVTPVSLSGAASALPPPTRRLSKRSRKT